MAYVTSNHMSVAQPRTGGCNDALWHACAGPLVNLPRGGERVYYFPQGHMEQLEASMHQGLEQQMPLFNLPSKILCKVVNVQRRITLLPDPDQSEVTSPDTLSQNLKNVHFIHFVRHLLCLTQAIMVVFLLFEGMLMIACLHWICPNSHLGRN